MSRAPPPRLHFDDGSRVMLAEGGAAGQHRRRQQESGAPEPPSPSAVAMATSDRDHAVPLDEYYGVESTCDEIVRRLNLAEKIGRDADDDGGGDDGFLCRVALQFPDQLLPDAAEVCWRVEEGMIASLRRSLDRGGGGGDGDTNDNEPPVLPEPLVFVLGDTTHGSCCVDEVAAMHLDADVVVHHGPACLTSAPSVPVIYRFGRAALDVESCARSILDGLLREEEQEQEREQEQPRMRREGDDCGEEETTGRKRVLLLYDVRYHHAVDSLASRLSRDDRGVEVDVVVGRIPSPPRRRADSKPSPCCDSSRAADKCCAGAVPSAANGPRTDGVTTLGNRCRAEGVSSESATSITTPNDPSDTNGCDRRTTPAAIVTIGGLEIPPLDGGESSLSDHVMVYIGAPRQQQLVNILLRCSGTGGTRACWVYDPAGTADDGTTDANSPPRHQPPRGTLHTDAASTCSRDLARRFYQTQRARMATTFGIVVGTLGASRFRDVVETLRAKIRDAGKSSYVLAVGKVNVAKLANFAEIECFVFVGCPETSSGLLLSELGREFHVPVITPLELDVALGCREWDGFYSHDFGDFLGGGGVGGDDVNGVGAARGENDDEGGDGVTTEEDHDDDDDAPYFSLISGRYESSGTRGGTVDGLAGAADEASSGGVAMATGTGVGSSNDGQIAVYRSEAAEFLKRREYQGLRSDIGKNAVAPAKEGQVGIASDYGER